MSRSSPTLLQRSQRLTEASRILLDEMIQLESKSVEVIVHARDAVAHAIKQSMKLNPPLHRVRTCPVFVNQKPCGLELLRNSDGLYYCELGHRTRVIE
jgi:hypothetical protein